MPINFFSEDTLYKLQHSQKTRSWIKKIANQEKRKIKTLNFIFCNDAYLLKINQQFLHHSSFTDIITFDHSEDKNSIEGDIYISIERIKENASSLKIPFEDELNRVIIHGILHLLGLKDKTEEEKHSMREKENACLSLLR